MELVENPRLHAQNFRAGVCRGSRELALHTVAAADVVGSSPRTATGEMLPIKGPSTPGYLQTFLYVDMKSTGPSGPSQHRRGKTRSNSSTQTSISVTVRMKDCPRAVCSESPEEAWVVGHRRMHPGDSGLTALKPKTVQCSVRPNRRQMSRQGPRPRELMNCSAG